MRSRLILLPLLFISGCSKKVMVARNIHVKANGYMGEALITCSGESDSDVTVTLDSEGLATSPCPSDSSRVYIEENGKTTRTSNFFWTKSDDGLPDSVSIGVPASGY
jgi:hypothetical protein